MSLREFLQSGDSYRALKKELGGKNFSHAYIVLGGDRSVRAEYADFIASFILCPYGGCGVCAVCKRILSQNHPDVKYLNTDGKMSVKSARELVEEAYVTGVEGVKIFFFDNAEKLSPAVQNTLLKIYEEPPESSVFVLLAASEAGILQTVRSRAKKIYLPVFSAAEIFRELQAGGVDERTAETASVLAGGRFDRAYKFADSAEYSEQYENCFELLLGCRRSADIAKYLSSPVFNKESIGLTLEFFEIILGDVLASVAGGGKAPAAIRRQRDIASLARGFTPGGVAMAILAVTEAAKLLSSYVSTVSVAERVLFKILEAKYKWQ